MATCREKGYAKLNLYLNVLAKDTGYHALDSLVCTVDLFDSVTVTSRKDKKIVVRTGGLYKLPCLEASNNAYKAAALFMETFNTKGVDIVITKRIPLSGGMGGSSADIAATLLAMKKLYHVTDDVKPLADSLGSDSGFLLSGGFARLQGKGNLVTPLNFDGLKLHFVVVTVKNGVNTAECFEKFDAVFSEAPTVVYEDVVKNLSEGKIVKENFKNMLYGAASEINKGIAETYEKISALSPIAVSMTGSGSSVFGIFETKELCLWAADALKKQGYRAIVCESLSYSEIHSEKFIKNPFVL